VVYGGRLYQCQQAHTSLSNWTPPATPALWVDLGACPGFPLTQLTVASVTSDPNPTTGGTTNLVYQVSSPSAGAYAGQTVSGARVYLKIYTVAERLVWSQVFGESEASTGEHKVLWDCRDRMGSSLANGVYYFSVTVEVKDQRNTKLTPLLILK